MARILRMNFRTAGGRAASITVQNPVEDPSAGDVDAVMDMVINNDIFDTSSGAITEKVNAVLVATEEEEILNFEEQ